MIQITKEEAKKIRKLSNDVVISRTMKQKSKRGHFFMEETSVAKEILEKIRNGT